MELKIEHISKRFKDKMAVDDVSLTLTTGVWGLLGANGAGKTTLMRMIADIMEPSNGSISFDGEDIARWVRITAISLAFCIQDFGYSRDFTVKDYLEYVAALKDVPPRETTKKINPSTGYSHPFRCEREKDCQTIWRYETSCRNCTGYAE